MYRLLVLSLCLLSLTAHFFADGPALDWLAPAAATASLPADTFEPSGQCEAHALGLFGPRLASVELPPAFLVRWAEPGWRLVSWPLSPQLPPPKIA
jgi:hypothetical protein